MERAAHLLNLPLSIKEIAHVFGYYSPSSPSHFSNAFKRRHGISPKEFRCGRNR